METKPMASNDPRAGSELDLGSERGDLRPKEWPKNRRIRPTDRNIMAQQIGASGNTDSHDRENFLSSKTCKIDERHDAKGQVTQLGCDIHREC